MVGSPRKSGQAGMTPRLVLLICEATEV